MLAELKFISKILPVLGRISLDFLVVGHFKKQAILPLYYVRKSFLKTPF